MPADLPNTCIGEKACGERCACLSVFRVELTVAWGGPDSIDGGRIDGLLGTVTTVDEVPGRAFRNGWVALLNRLVRVAAVGPYCFGVVATQTRSYTRLEWSCCAIRHPLPEPDAIDEILLKAEASIARGRLREFIGSFAVA